MESKPEKWSFALGAAFWVLVSAVAVLARGVEWDETYEHAQVLAGLVHYPAGHPLALYVHKAFSLQTWLGAGLLRAGLGPEWYCGLRNFAYLLATVLPVYCLGALLTRRAAWGSVAAALVLQGVLLEFDGSYPAAVWPVMYSNGHIGGGVVLLALCAIAADRPRTAAFLAGILPCVHAGQSPVLLAVAALYGAAYLRRVGWRRARGAMIWLGAGAAVCVALWCVQHAFPAAPAEGSYALTGNEAANYRGYTEYHDPHRRFPPENGQIALVGALFLSVLAAWRSGDAYSRRAYGWLAAYSVGICAAVWGAMLAQAAWGPDTPFWIQVWMPYRFINHAGPIALAVAVSVLWGGGMLRALPLAGLAVGLLGPVWRLVFGDALFERYLAMGDGVAFGLCGAALWTLLRGLGGRGALALCAAISGMWLWAGHAFGAASLGAGAAVAEALLRWSAKERDSRCCWERAAAILSIVVVVVATWHQARFHEALQKTAFFEEASAVLETEGAPQAMLLTPPDAFLVQAQTGHPVLADVATASYISYVPSLGPAIEAIYMDCFGIDLTAPQRAGGETWERTWTERPAAVWRDLAAAYGFTYVIAPERLSVGLPMVCEGGGWRLYRVANQ